MDEGVVTLQLSTAPPVDWLWKTSRPMFAAASMFQRRTRPESEAVEGVAQVPSTGEVVAIGDRSVTVSAGPFPIGVNAPAYPPGSVSALPSQVLTSRWVVSK